MFSFWRPILLAWILASGYCQALSEDQDKPGSTEHAHPTTGDTETEEYCDSEGDACDSPSGEDDHPAVECHVKHSQTDQDFAKLKGSIVQARKEIEQAEKLRTHDQKQIQNLSSVLDYIRTECRTNYSETGVTFTQLRSRIDHTRRTLKKVENIGAHTRDQFIKMARQIQHLDHRKDSLITELSGHDSDTRRNFSEVHSTLEKTAGNIESLSSDLKSTSQSISAALNNIGVKIETLEGRETALDGKSKTTEMLISGLQTSMAAVSADLMNLADKSSELYTDVTGNRDTIDQVDRRLQLLETQVLENKDELRKSTGIITAIESIVIPELKNDLARKTKRFERADETFATHDGDIQRLQQQGKTNEGKIADILDSLIPKLDSKFEGELRTDRQYIEKKIRELDQNIKSSTESLEGNLDTVKSQLEQRIGEHTTTLNSHRITMEQHKSGLEKHEARQQELGEFIKNVQTTLDKARQQLQETDEKHYSTLDTHTTKIELHDGLLGKYADRQRELEQMIEDLNTIMEEQRRLLDITYTRTIATTSEIKTKYGFPELLIGFILGLVVAVSIFCIGLCFWWQRISQLLEPSRPKTDAGDGKILPSPKPKVKANYFGEPNTAGMEKSICVVGFHEGTLSRYVQLTNSVCASEKVNVRQYLVRGISYIQGAPQVMLHLVFVDFNERNVILEDPSLIQGELRKSLVEHLLNSKADVFVVYTGDKGSAVLPEGSLYNAGLISIKKHKVLSALEKRKRVLTMDKNLNDCQLQHIRKTIRQLLTNR